MTVQDYLLKFRKISSLESLEKLYDHLNYTLTDDQELINMYRAADHRRAELVSGGRFFYYRYRHVVLHTVVDHRFL
ncbi:transcription modulator YdgT [Escherichia coli]